MTWREIEIGELGKIVTGKTPPTANREMYDGDYMFVTPTDLDWQSYYVRKTHSTVTQLAREKLKNQFIPANSTVFTCIGNTIGKCGLTSEDCLSNQQINSVVPSEQHDPRFVYYLLNFNRPKIRSIGLSGGAAQPIINKTTFSSVKVSVPETKAEEEAISKALSAYDDLIENNRRRIALLEEAARLLYREWFVHFRFPGLEHVKIVDGVPEGWSALPASEVVEINPKTGWDKDKPITMVPMAALSESGMTVDSSCFQERTKSTGVRFQNGDTLLARITPCLENGKTGFVDFLANSQVACGSTEFIVLREKLVSRYFIYLMSREDSFRDNAIVSMVGSSGRQRVQPSCFDKYNVPIPPEPIADAFDEIVGPMFDQISVLRSSSAKLVEARDLLLPRLMDGRLEVAA